MKMPTFSFINRLLDVTGRHPKKTFYTFAFIIYGSWLNALWAVLTKVESHWYLLIGPTFSVLFFTYNTFFAIFTLDEAKKMMMVWRNKTNLNFLFGYNNSHHFKLSVKNKLYEVVYHDPQHTGGELLFIIDKSVDKYYLNISDEQISFQSAYRLFNRFAIATMCKKMMVKSIAESMKLSSTDMVLRYTQFNLDTQDLIELERIMKRKRKISKII